MLEIKKIASISVLNSLKKQYFSQSTAPLDGMWHFGFVPMAQHFGFYVSDNLVGFCCIDSDGYLLQFYLDTSNDTSPQALFTLITEQTSKVLGKVKGAFVSTAEPQFMSLCLDNSSEFKVNALMYQQDKNRQVINKSLIEMEVVTAQQLCEYVQFSVTHIDAPQEWLKGYYTNLIKREELLGYRIGNHLVAVGECRLFDEYQLEYADLGIIVDKSKRGQGIAKDVLHFLSVHAESKGLKPMCSTECDNIGAQKAIFSAGFTAMNRIVQFEFTIA